MLVKDLKPSKKEKILMLLDSHAILHRAYHALPNFTTSSGEPTGALYGFSAVLLKILKEFSPDYIAACFDLPKPTFRHAVYKEYKAKRPKIDDDLSSQISRSKEILAAFKIPVYEYAGFEADDILGTIVEQVKNKENLKTIIASGDLDTLQLVKGDSVVVYTLRGGIKDTALYNENEVLKRFGFKPEFMPDFKGLRGDASDNIKGVPGIGDKTAETLIKKFGSLDKLYKELEKNPAFLKEAGVKDRIIEILKNNRDNAFFSRELAEIRRDAPVKFNLNETARAKNDDRMGKAKELFGKFDFKSLILRIDELSGIEPKTTAGKEEKSQKSAVEKFNKEKFESAGEYFFILEENDVFAGLKFKGSEAASVVKITDGDLKQNKDFFASAFNSKKPRYAYNSKELLHYLSKFGLEEIVFDFDAAIASWLIESHLSEPSISDVLRIAKKDHLTDPASKNKAFSLFFEAREAILDELKKLGLLDVFSDIEMPLVGVIYKMEKIGIAVDAGYLKNISIKYGKKIKQLEKEIWRDVGGEFNISSTKQLSVVLFEKLKLKTSNLKKTEKGNRSTRFSELLKLKGSHPVVDRIIAYRESIKLLSTYINPLLEMVGRDGRLHTNYIQTGTVTGRFASKNPNLQNLPIKKESAKDIRSAFKPKKGFVFLSCDYSQIELRIAAILSKDKTITEAFKNGKDVHSETAAKVFNVDFSEVTPEMRSKAKAINFGILYGMGVNTLAFNLGISREEARSFSDSYFENFPEVKNWIKNTAKSAEEKGYVETLFGRKRFLPQINSNNFILKREAERMAVNMPIQGTAADIIKMAMIEINKTLGGKPFKGNVYMILQVHDELLFEVKKEFLSQAAEKIKGIMENVYKGDLVLKTDVKIGENYSELKNINSKN